MKSWRGKHEFKAYVLRRAAKLNVQVRSLAVRLVRNKWASRSTSGRLNFNTELLLLPRDVVDYVIVYELLPGRLWKVREPT
jgi:predicted metal-dependent hydrolase